MSPESSPRLTNGNTAQDSTDIKWDDALKAVESLHVPKDAVERVDDIASFRAEDILAAATVLHTELAPNESHEPHDEQSYVKGPGENAEKRMLAKPEERLQILDFASQQLALLKESMQPGEEQAYLARAGNIIALSLVLAHVFKDGNGRTSRTLAHVVREGHINEDDLKIVGANRNEKGFRIDSYVPTKDGLAMDPYQLLEAAGAKNIPLSETSDYYQFSRSVFTTPYSD